MKKTILLAALLSIAGCASNIDRQKEEAQKSMDQFIDRAEKFNQEFETEKKPLTLPRWWHRIPLAVEQPPQSDLNPFPPQKD